MGQVITYSQLKLYRFCPQAYFYKYIEGLQVKRKPKPLKVGTVIHELIACWATGHNYETLLKRLDHEWKNMFDEEKEFYGDLPRLARWIIKHYVERYARERKHYELVEHTCGPIPLTTETEFKFRIDRLLRESKRDISLCETKTGKKIPEEGVRVFDLQTVLYTWALRQLGQNVTSITWDYIRTKEPAIPKILKDGSVSARSDIDTDYETFYQALQDNGCDPNAKEYKHILRSLRGADRKWFDRVKLPVKESMIEPVVRDAQRTSRRIVRLAHTPVRHLSGFTCPRCQYQALCYAVLRDLDVEFIKHAEFKSRGKEEYEEAEESSED